MLTIKQFSQITAIPESTLRYYDEQGLLPPGGRAENGYRLYRADQILPAKFLYSLRLASIPMDAVRAYQQGAHHLLESWHRELGERIAWLTQAQLYIDSLLQGQADPVTLQVTPAQRVVWFTHEEPVGRFGRHYDAHCQELRAAGFAPAEAYFRHLADLAPGAVRGQVGFRVTGPAHRLPLPPGAELEEQPERLTLSLEHRDDMARVPETYQRLCEFMAAHGWQPAGPPLERYPVGPPNLYVEVLFPILQVGR